MILKNSFIMVIFSVTNNLQVQDVYSIRGLSEGTTYDLKVTAHNHAGSSSQLYQFTTLNAFGNPALPRGGLATVLHGLGFRATLSIVVSVLCLVLASLGVCFCIRKKQVSKRPGRYDEMPKSATMENRHNLEQQFYATVQRKTPALTPFSSGYEVDTIEQLKKAVRSQVEKIPETAADISPYATSNFQTMPMGGPIGRNTIGRKETLRMTDYHRQQVSQADMGRPRDTETTGWRSGTPGKRVRRRYSESEEYDSDSDTDRNESSRTESSNQLDQERFHPLRYRTQFNL